MAVILIFLATHWYLSVFAQSFFLHRYMAHRMFRLNMFWERFFYLFTFLTQGSSFLHPKAYAQLHLEHHVHSDTEDDPHSPHFFEDVFSMMRNTARVYLEFKSGNRRSTSPYVESLPTWPSLDAFANTYLSRALFCTLYFGVYLIFAPAWYWFLLLPLHFLMGPVHGAFVNWCGHKYGYRNHETGDESRNTFVWDFLFMGETFQNNHHRYPNRANFANRWFEIDLAYPIIWILNRLKIVRFTNGARLSR